MVALTKCDSCLNSRIVISENGVHSVCCLSEKKEVECITKEKNHYEEMPKYAGNKK